MNEPPQHAKSSPTASAMPSILLVEDDPVSAAFLCEAAGSLPALVDVAGSLAEALQMAASHSHDLFLIDAHLPDGRGESLLQVLRDLGRRGPALAHTAAVDAAVSACLMSAGFLDVLCKPLTVADLLQALRRQLPASPGDTPSGGKLPLWDDAVALAALGGERSNVLALRGLFLGELPGQRERISKASALGNAGKVRDELHRLVASCGFVGAPRLACAVRDMQAKPLDSQALSALQFAIDDVLASA